MEVEEIEGTLGKSVKDLYGRHVGFVTGFLVEGNGKVRSVGLELCSGRFEEHPGSRFVVGEEGPILVPGWKLEAETLGREASLIKKRLEALAFLSKRGEIAPHLNEEMGKEYAGRLKSLGEDQANQSKQLSDRVSELEAEVEALDRFIANLKLQRHAGEIEEPLYEKMNSSCMAMRAKNLQEKEELTRALDAGVEPVETLTMTITQKKEGVRSK